MICIAYTMVTLAFNELKCNTEIPESRNKISFKTAVKLLAGSNTKNKEKKSKTILGNDDTRNNIDDKKNVIDSIFFEDPC